MKLYDRSLGFHPASSGICHRNNQILPRGMVVCDLKYWLWSRFMPIYVNFVFNFRVEPMLILLLIVSHEFIWLYLHIRVLDIDDYKEKGVNGIECDIPRILWMYSVDKFSGFLYVIDSSLFSLYLEYDISRQKAFMLRTLWLSFLIRSDCSLGVHYAIWYSAFK